MRAWGDKTSSLSSMDRPESSRSGNKAKHHVGHMLPRCRASIGGHRCQDWVGGISSLSRRSRWRQRRSRRCSQVTSCCLSHHAQSTPCIGRPVQSVRTRDGRHLMQLWHRGARSTSMDTSELVVDLESNSSSQTLTTAGLNWGAKKVSSQVIECYDLRAFIRSTDW